MLPNFILILVTPVTSSAFRDNKHVFVATSVAMAGVIKQKEVGIEDINGFTSRLLTEALDDYPEESLIISPLWAFLPLATDVIRDEQRRSFVFQNADAIKTTFYEVNSEFRSATSDNLKMANRLYVNEDSNLKYFTSDVVAIDFSQSEVAAQTINSWVAENTNNFIKDIIEPGSIDADTSSILVNALYYKGKWSSQFDTKLTTDRDFYAAGDKTVSLPTMYRRGTYKYEDSTELQAKLIEIPFEDEHSSLLVILPADKNGITQLQEKLKDSKILETAQKNMSETEVDLYLPKFKIESERSLKDISLEIPVKKVVGNNVDDSDKFVTIGEAKQKAYVEIDEEGAQSAAVNVDITPVSRMLNTVELPVFRADHPFVFFMKTKGIAVFGGVYSP